MLAVHRYKFSPWCSSRLLGHWSAGYERLFVGQGQTSPGQQRCQRDFQTREANDAVDTHVCLGAKAGQPSCTRPDFDTRKTISGCKGNGLVENGDHPRSEGLGLGHELVKVSPRRTERHYLESLGLGRYDIECLGSDRTGRAGQRNGGGQRVMDLADGAESHREPEHGGEHEQHAVEAVEQTAMSREDR